MAGSVEWVWWGQYGGVVMVSMGMSGIGMVEMGMVGWVWWGGYDAVEWGWDMVTMVG